MARKNLSWRPVRYVREGVKRFCSPACGHHCTQAEYAQVLADAATLAKALGPGWSPVISENLGWHFKVAHPSGIELHRFGPRRYWASVIIDGRQYKEEASTPAECVQGICWTMRKHLAAVSTILARMGDPLVKP